MEPRMSEELEAVMARIAKGRAIVRVLTKAREEVIHLPHRRLRPRPLSSSSSSSSTSDSSSSSNEDGKKKKKKKKKKKDKVTRKVAEKVSVPVYPKMHQLDLWKSQLTMALVTASGDTDHSKWLK